MRPCSIPPLPVVNAEAVAAGVVPAEFDAKREKK